MTPLLQAYRLLAFAVEPFLPGLLRARARRGKEDPSRLAERLGREPGGRPAGRLIHLHGASVGETLSLLPLIEALRTAAPDATLLVTSATLTSATLLAERLPAGVLHRYAPVDTPGAAAGWTRRWRPDLSVFVESEIWPGWLAALRGAGVKTALVSARLSDASLRGWRRAAGSAREVFGGFDLVAAQDDAMAAALSQLGAWDGGRLNLKLAGPALPVDEALKAEFLEALGDAPMLLAASTHPGEERIALDAWRRLPGTVLVIVPRHPDRGPAIKAMAGGSARLQSEGPSPQQEGVFVADRLGELGSWFGLARRASVLLGGSLAPGIGGHNPLEAVRGGAAVVRGPHVENWRKTYAALNDAAPVVTDAEALSRFWLEDLADPQRVAARAQVAAERMAVLAARSTDIAGFAARLLALSARTS